VVVNNDDRVFVFWAYGSQFTYYRYLDNENWSEFYCPYCDSADVYAFADGHYISGSLMYWIGSSYSYNYYGERAQYYQYDISSNTWKNPEMICNDTVLVDIDVAKDNNDLPVCVYRNKPPGVDRTKFIKKEGNNWSSPELVACVDGLQREQQIAVDQNNDVHIIEQQHTSESEELVHYKKQGNNWIGQYVDTSRYFAFPNLTFKNNMLFCVYGKGWVVGTEVFSDIFFTRQDIITNIKEETQPLPKLKIYPNPGRDNIYIEFENNKTQNINLSVYDINGKHIITLMDKIKPQGVYRPTWRGTDKHRKEVSPGLYFVRLQFGLPDGNSKANTITQLVEIIK